MSDRVAAGEISRRTDILRLILEKAKALKFDILEMGLSQNEEQTDLWDGISRVLIDAESFASNAGTAEQQARWKREEEEEARKVSA